MAEAVRVRRLTGDEGTKLHRLVRRGKGHGKASVARYWRALVVQSSAGGNTVPVIARLVQTSTRTGCERSFITSTRWVWPAWTPNGRVAAPAG